YPGVASETRLTVAHCVAHTRTELHPCLAVMRSVVAGPFKQGVAQRREIRAAITRAAQIGITLFRVPRQDCPSVVFVEPRIELRFRSLRQMLAECGEGLSLPPQLSGQQSVEAHAEPAVVRTEPRS